MVYLMFNDKNFENFVKAALELMCVGKNDLSDSGSGVIVCDAAGYKSRKKSPFAGREAYVVVAADENPVTIGADAVPVLYPLSLVGLRSAVETAEKIADGVRRESGFDTVRYDRIRRIVSYHGADAFLSPREGKLFEALFECRGEAVSRDVLREKAFDITETAGKGSNVVDVYINYLRKRLSPIFGGGAVATVRGIGYALKI